MTIKTRLVTYMVVPRTVYDVVMHESSSHSDGSEGIYSETVGTFEKEHIAHTYACDLCRSQKVITDGTKDMSDTFTRVEIARGES